MSAIRVETARRRLTAFGSSFPCLIGRGGSVAAVDKREGDGATPLGRWPIRAALLRPDRIAPPATMRLAWRCIRPDDGWSDDPADPAYNRPVRHPHRFSAERLWHEGGAYDIVLVLGYNDAAPTAGRGSAIFLHCFGTAAATEGCVAIDRDDLYGLMSLINPGDVAEIV